MNFEIKTPIAIVGMGRSGKAAFNFLISMGISPASICTFDFKPGIADYSDPSLLINLHQPKTFIVSPGVPLQLPWLQECKNNGAIISSEINLATAVLTSEKIIGITGSLGKSTTVSLLDAGLKSFSNNFFVGGNIGIPFCEYAIELITKKRTPADWIVLELSSYQLENSQSLILDHSAITYLASNHLERYESVNHYYMTKWNIHRQTKGVVFLNKFGGDILSTYTNNINEKFQFVDRTADEFHEFKLHENNLIGSHNIDNLALATKISMACSWPKSSIAAMKNFSGLAHRLENLGIFNGKKIINDSKATTIESVLSAVAASMEGLTQQNQLHILIGGKDKGLPWHLLSQLRINQNLIFYFFGECGPHAKEQSKLAGDVFKDLEGATKSALQNSSPGDSILLSPGGTSLDQFSNFEERGHVFENLVKNS